MAIKAQNPVFRVLNNLNGLPSNTIYDIMQDTAGYIWVTHNKGLSRYDGKVFLNIKSKAVEGKALSNLIQYKTKLWCQDFGGKFYRLDADSLIEEKSIRSSNIFVSAALSKQHQIVTFSNDSTMVFDIENNTMSGFPIKEVFKHFIVKNNGNIKIFHVNKLLDLNGNIERVEKKLYKRPIYYMEVVGGKYYGFTKKTFPYVIPFFEDSEPIPILHKGLFIHAVHVIKDEVWICTSTGAYCFDHNWKPKYNGNCFFQGTSISKVLKDRENNYWFCTLNRGLLFVPNIDIQLFSFHKASITALALQYPDNQLLVGTEKNEVFALNAKNIFVKKYSEQVNHEIIGIKSNENGLYLYTHEFAHLSKKFKKKWVKDVAVKDFTRITKEINAVAYSGGVMLIASDGQVTKVPNWLKMPYSSWTKERFFTLIEKNMRGRAVCFDPKDSTLYTATTQGIYYFSPQGQGTISYQGKPILATKIKVFDNQVFAATYGYGLMTIDHKIAKPFIATQQGIQSDVVYNFYKKGTVFWLLEDGVMQAYNTQNQSIVKYNYSDGLPKAEINDILIHQDKVYLATTEGLVVLGLNQNTHNAIAPLLAINDIKVNGQSRPLLSYTAFKTEEKNIDIYFSVLSFKGEGDIKVDYQINDSEWISLPHETRTISLTALAPGYYSIKIKAMNEDGVNGIPISYNFKIATPWYQQWFVLLSAIILVLYMMYGYFTRRINLIEKNNALVAEKLRLEQEVQKNILASIKSQMNPHFIFNALNTIQSYIYTNDKENASFYLGKFSDLTRSILEMSTKETIPLSEEIKALKLYLDLEKLRFEDTLIYEIKIDDGIDDNWVRIPSMLIQPYVENAIKHGLLHKKNDRKLLINFSMSEQALKVTIDDNGVGRQKAAALNQQRNKQYESFAINANRKRLDILNHGKTNQIVMNIIDKADDQQHPSGTRVELFIPFNN
jgi:hypothetical protein